MASLISIQMNGGVSVQKNLDTALKLIENAMQYAQEQRLLVLPECFSVFGVAGTTMLNAAERFGAGKIQDFLSEIARYHACFIVAGTTPIIGDIDVGQSNINATASGLYSDMEPSEKYTAASLVFDPNGTCISRYNKIHMFDVEVADATKSYRESRYTQAGTSLALFDTPFGQVAQSVCYDLRFAQMFASYSNYTRHHMAPEIIVVPSAFTRATGEAHWHALLQARSIENQSYVVASNQVGKHADGRQTFGNSCIYSPWGECIARVEDNKQSADAVSVMYESGEGFAIAHTSQKLIDSIRAKMPVGNHKKERYTL
jgi:predicted amidohydrolase